MSDNSVSDTEKIEFEKTVEEIKKDIDEALQMFGEYSYYDKGPEEVMDVRCHAICFKRMAASDVATILRDVLQHPHGQPFVESTIRYLDKQPDAWWEELMSAHNELLREFY